MPILPSMLIARFTSLVTAPLALAATPSATPGCSYTCADMDRGGYALRTSASGVNNGVLHCDYPTTSSAATNVYYCEYNPSTGVLTKAHDYYSDTGAKTTADSVHYCPDSVRVCTGSRRYAHEDNLTAVLAKQAAAAAAADAPDDTNSIQRRDDDDIVYATFGEELFEVAKSAAKDSPMAKYGEDDRIAGGVPPPTPAAVPLPPAHLRMRRMHRMASVSE